MAPLSTHFGVLVSCFLLLDARKTVVVNGRGNINLQKEVLTLANRTSTEAPKRFSLEDAGSSVFNFFAGWLEKHQLKVTKVTKIVNPGLRERYDSAKAEMSDDPDKIDQGAFGSSNISLLGSNISQFGEALNEKMNEVFLWHGSRSASLLAIAENGFRFDEGGEVQATNLLGPGLYFTDHALKADEYTVPEVNGRLWLLYQAGRLKKSIANAKKTPVRGYGRRVMLCKVALGKFTPLNMEKGKEAPAMIINNPQPKIWTHREQFGAVKEYVIRTPERALPLYIIRYTGRP